MFRKTQVCRAALLTLAGVGAFTAPPVQAQQVLEKVEITGSAVRRIEAETGLPVQVLKREDIERSGATSTVDLLQRLPAIQGGTGESAAVGGLTFGFSGASIHNINDQRTLVLLNGHRLALFGGQQLTGFAAGVDLNSIPISAIERVEILTDGASSLYGSDAVAGVVNFITKRNTTEGDVTLGLSSPTQGGARESRISATKGFGSLQDDGYNVMLTFGHDERTNLESKQRDYAKTGKIFFSANGKNYRIQQFSPNAIPANVVDDQGQLVSPYRIANGRCPPRTFEVIEPYNDGSGLVDHYCGFDYTGELEIYPERKRDNLFASATKKLGDHELFADLLWSETKQISRIAPVPGPFFLPATSPLFAQYLNPVGINGNDFFGAPGTLALYRMFDLGKRTSDDKATFFDVALGSRGFVAGWDYTAIYTHSESEAKENISGYPGSLAVGNLLDSGLLDPFVGPGLQSAAAQAGLDAINYRGYWDGGISKLDTISLRGSRELMRLPAGPLMLGTGVAWQRERFQSKPSLFSQAKLADPVAGTLCDPNDPALPCDQRFGDEAANVPYSQDRKVYAAFGELVIPATKTLELTAAVRHDHYSDFGDTTNAKGSFRWTPRRNLLIRGSVGTGFHAPSVPQVNASLQPFGVTNDDYTCTPELQQVATAVGGECQQGSKQYDIISGGNKDLKPEKSRQASLGIRFEPTPAVSMGADLWHVNIRDAFGQVDEAIVFADPLKYSSFWTTKLETSTGINRLAFLNQNANLGKEYYTGLDVDVIGRGRTPVGELTSQLAFTYMIREARQLLKDGPYYSSIGNFAELGGANFRWQGRWTNTIRYGAWAHTLAVNFKSGYKDSETTVEVLDAAGNPTGDTEDIRLRIKEYFTLDWQTQWNPRKNLQLTVGVLNLLDEDPPLSISITGVNRGQPFGYDDRYYDPRGRTVYANLSYKF
jgi:iron complex outermembrane receptor protein